jgi:hypothetical protein
LSDITLSTGTFTEDFHPPEIVLRIAIAAFNGMAAAHDQLDMPFATGRAREALCALLAMMIESLPAVRSDHDLDIMADHARGRILDYLRQYRSVYFDSGKHFIEILGAEIEGRPPAPAAND